MTYETVYDEEMTYKDDLLSISEYGPYDDDDYDEDTLMVTMMVTMGKKRELMA